MCDPALGKPPGCYWLYREVFGAIKKEKKSLYTQYPGARISCRMNKVLSNLILYHILKKFLKNRLTIRSTVSNSARRWSQFPYLFGFLAWQITLQVTFLWFNCWSYAFMIRLYVVVSFLGINVLIVSCFRKKYLLNALNVNINVPTLKKKK